MIELFRCRTGKEAESCATQLRSAIAPPPQVQEAAKGIVEGVRNGGDGAVREYTKRFDGIEIGEFFIPEEEVRNAARRAPSGVSAALRTAASNIRRFHEKDLPANTRLTGGGCSLTRKYFPLRSAGLYVPGGMYPYPSTVLMTAIPASLAGVEDIVVATPPSIMGSAAFSTFAAACRIGGVDRVLTVGGAQAIAALAFGTESIPRVDKIAGPGNAYVTAAKAIVSSMGAVGIESLPGPTELLVIADGAAVGQGRLIAYDMLAQAEHLSGATSVLCTSSSRLASEVDRQVGRIITSGQSLPSLAGSMKIVVVKGSSDLLPFAEAYSPEHLLAVGTSAERQAMRARNSGSVFIGRYSAVAFGDYISGSNHVLPTMGTARFSSPLGVRDFMKCSEFQKISRRRAAALSQQGARIAEAEGLLMHAASMKCRAAEPEVN